MYEHSPIEGPKGQVWDKMIMDNKSIKLVTVCRLANNNNNGLVGGITKVNVLDLDYMTFVQTDACRRPPLKR